MKWKNRLSNRKPHNAILITFWMEITKEIFFPLRIRYSVHIIIVWFAVATLPVLEEFEVKNLACCYLLAIIFCIVSKTFEFFKTNSVWNIFHAESTRQFWMQKLFCIFTVVASMVNFLWTTDVYYVISLNDMFTDRYIWRLKLSPIRYNNILLFHFMLSCSDVWHLEVNNYPTRMFILHKLNIAFL